MTAASTPTRDELPSLDLPAIRDLADLGRRWVGWRYETRGGKPTKVPIQLDGSKASCTAPSTWATYADCYGAAVRGLGDGLGVALTGDGLVGVDLDHVIDDAGNVDPKAQAIVDGLDSYTEVSPSGTGLRVFVRGALPPGRRKRGPIECYSTERYLTVTGRHLAGTPEAIEDRGEELAKFHAEHLGGAEDAERAAGTEYERRAWDGELPARVADLGTRVPRVGALLNQRHTALGFPSESEADLALAGALAALGVEGADIEATLRWRRRGDGKDGQYFERTVRRVLADLPPPSAEDAERRRIHLSDRQLDDVVADSVAALVASNDPARLFVRAGDVVTVQQDEDGRPVVREIREAALVDLLAEAAHWTKDSGKTIREDGPSMTLASIVLARLARVASLPALRGITESPLLREDGSILNRPGYDPATMLYYRPARGFVLAPVPERPTALELEDARALLDELVCDFPFRSDGDYATAIVGLLTVPLRECIPGCVPAFLFDAPAAGTGKGLLADVISETATGGLAAKMPEPDAKSDEEWRKRITALLAEGRAVVVLDNVERPLGSASLAAALTTSVWSDRILGSSRMVTLPNRAVWCATGNNIRLRGDLPRRCVWARLDAREARPWQRTNFRHPDLLGWVRERRGELLGAMFTLARAWIAAGRPGPAADTPLLGSFESWRNVVGGVLNVAGITGFLQNVETLYNEADEETPAWAGFLIAWRAEYGDRAVPATSLVEDVREQRDGGLRMPPRRPELRAALPPAVAELVEKPGAARQIGSVFARKAETRFVVDDVGSTLRLVRDFDTHAGAARWVVA